MKKPILYISLTLAAALLFSACGKTEDVIRPGETVATDLTTAPVAGGGTLQKDGARWSITSLADWDEFDYDGNFSDNCHAFLRALFEGESDFDGFRTLRVSEYKLTRDEKEYGLPCLYVEFTVTASDIEALPVGAHTAILTDTVDCFLVLDGVAPKDDSAFADDPAANAVRGWIESRLRWSVPDFGTADAADAVAALLAVYGEDGALPFDTLRTLAAEKFGVTLTETDIGGSLDVRDGKLFVVAEDAQPNMLYNYVVTDVQESGDGTDVTVQFFADCNGFFKSHEVVYTVGQDGALRGCTVKTASPYSPYGLRG